MVDSRFLHYQIAQVLQTIILLVVCLVQMFVNHIELSYARRNSPRYNGLKMKQQFRLPILAAMFVRTLQMIDPSGIRGIFTVLPLRVMTIIFFALLNTAGIYFSRNAVQTAANIKNMKKARSPYLFQTEQWFTGLHLYNMFGSLIIVLCILVSPLKWVDIAWSVFEGIMIILTLGFCCYYMLYLSRKLSDTMSPQDDHMSAATIRANIKVVRGKAVAFGFIVACGVTTLVFYSAQYAKDPLSAIELADKDDFSKYTGVVINDVLVVIGVLVLYWYVWVEIGPIYGRLRDGHSTTTLANSTHIRGEDFEGSSPPTQTHVNSVMGSMEMSATPV